MKDPGLVVLDEASSRLDPATEAMMEYSINRLFEGRTGVVIAHRLKTVERADDILILEAGRQVEYGPRAGIGRQPPISLLPPAAKGHGGGIGMSTQTATSQARVGTVALNLRLIRCQARVFALHSAFTLLVFGLQIVPGLIVKTIFDTIGGGAGAVAGPWAGLNPLWWLIFLYILTSLAQVGLYIGYEWYGWTFRMALAALLRRNLFASLLRRRGDLALPMASGEAINRFRDDVEEVTDFPLWLPDQAGKWIAAAIAVVIMAQISLKITLVVFLPLMGIMVLSRLAWRSLVRYSQARGRATDAVTGYLGEMFGAVQAIKVAGAEEAVTGHFDRLNDTRRTNELRLALTWELLNTLNSSVVTFGIAVMLLLAGQAIAGGTFTVGDFALFVSYLAFTTQVPSEIGTFYGDFKNQEVSIERMLEIIRPEPAEALVQFHPVYAQGPLPLSPNRPRPLIPRWKRCRSTGSPIATWTQRENQRPRYRGRFSSCEAGRLCGDNGAGRLRQVDAGQGVDRPDPAPRWRGAVEWRARLPARNLLPPAPLRLHRPGAAPVQRHAAREYPDGPA